MPTFESFFGPERLAAIPTETVYGLAAPIDREDLLKKIFKLKERPLFDPLIVHVSSLPMARTLTTHWDERAEKLARAFWPGPLTLVVPKGAGVSDLITAGLPTVGLRCPNHLVALDLINILNTPLAAPSANKFSKTSPTRAAHVRREFLSQDVVVVDGGPCEVGIESTIVALDQSVRLLRPGLITARDLEKVLQSEVVVAPESSPQAPGQFAVHYQPPYPLIAGPGPLSTERLREFSRKLALGSDAWEIAILPTDPLLAARGLYSLLHRPLAPGKRGRYLQLPEELTDLRWQAILDRVQKASSWHFFAKEGPACV